MQDQASQPEEIHRFPCQSCGSDLRYDPGADHLTCDHCGNTQAIEGSGLFKRALREEDFLSALDQNRNEADLEITRVLSCENCGAQIEFDPKVHAAECPYCATPVVTDTGPHRHIKPKALLPFALDERQAKAAMNTWLGRLWFAPNGLTEYARKGRKMQGIYVPYWTFDADTNSSYTGQRGTVYYETRTVRRGGETHRERVQKIRWRNTRGRVARFFDDVLILAATSLPKRFTDALAPWDLSHLEPYRPEYLAGFRAESYSVDLEDGFSEARAHMDRIIERDVKFDIGGDRQRIDHLQTDVRRVTFKHVLLPVWVAAYKYRGETYRFVVNGRSGQVKGERPWSVFKIALMVLVIALLAGAIGFAIAQAEQNGAVQIQFGSG
ncbi:MAG: primosomal protein N' (replication factor Y) - superfamily II helicase [Pseudomonadota bacterium]